jgi:hypothetical protein
MSVLALNTLIIFFVMEMGKAQEQPVPLKKRLVGEWTWVKTTASFIGAEAVTTSPGTCGCSKEIRITEDKIYLIKNDTVRDSSAYSVDEVRFLQDPVRYVLSSSIISNDVSFRKDTLVLGLSGICGTLEYYMPGNHPAKQNN